jgi:hypothetical protein
MFRPVYVCALTAVSLIGCADDDDDDSKSKAACSIEAQTGCADGLMCEEVVGDAERGSGCFTPIHVRGRVFDTLSSAAIAGAHVVLRDANGAAVSSVAVTAADGSYSLAAPVRRINAEGAPEQTIYTLRADAAGYLTFPKAPRVALPVEVSLASGAPPVMQSVATELGLIPLQSSTPTGSVSGRVLAERAAGTLVVAGGTSGIADRNGDYTVFNVPAGNVAV